MGGQYKDGSTGCEMEGVEWIDVAQGRDRWRALVNVVMKIWGYVKCGEFLD
jgi:hypothetical protein